MNVGVGAVVGFAVPAAVGALVALCAETDPFDKLRLNAAITENNTRNTLGRRWFFIKRILFYGLFRFIVAKCILDLILAAWINPQAIRVEESMKSPAWITEASTEACRFRGLRSRAVQPVAAGNSDRPALPANVL